MTYGINKVILLGRLGKDPEIKVTQSNLTIAKLSLATSETQKSDGQKVAVTTWHDVVFFGKLAELCRQFLQKGSLLYVEGKINKSRYTGKDGSEKTQYQVVGQMMQLLDSKKDQKQEIQENAKPESDFDDINIPF